MEPVKDDRSFEDTSIIVCVRARPLNEREISSSSAVALRYPSAHTLEIFEGGVSNAPQGSEKDRSPSSRHHQFAFDAVFDPSVSQERLYEMTGHPVICSSLKGFNHCIFAYGQTGSGKTFSMMGNDENPGIIPRLCQELFVEVEALKRQRAKEIQDAFAVGAAPPPSLDVGVYVSYLEIYMERIRCLLNPSQKEVPRVRQHQKLGVYVENLKEIPVTSSDQILQLMAAGNSQRRTAKTGMNDISSRSHAVFSIQLVQKNIQSAAAGGDAISELRSKINLVDLAGSERAKSTGAEGKRLKEGSQINQSLLALGQVIEALAKAANDQKQRHIPYRDSMLTFLLKESLGGNSKTLMLATVSPATINYEETLSTLRYADRAKSIVCRAFINETAGEKRIRELEEEVQQLRHRIQTMEEFGLTQARPESDLGPAAYPIGSPSGEEDISPGEDVSLMRSELSRAEELIQQLTKTAEDREIEALKILEQLHNQTTLHATREEPFLVNVGVGSWVMQYLVTKITVITRDLPSSLGNNEDSWVVKKDGKTYVCPPEEFAEGVGSPHCCFTLHPNRVVTLTAYDPHHLVTTVNNEKVVSERKLLPGDIISIAQGGLRFVFKDLSVPQPTPRRRTAPVMDISSLGTTAQPGPSSGASSAAKEERVSIPVLRLGVSPSHLLKPNAPSLAPQRSNSDAPFGLTSRRSSSLSLSTGRAYTHRTGGLRSSTPLGGSRRRAVTPNAGLSAAQKKRLEAQFIRCRHNFILIGPSRSGKSYSIQNILKPDRWYNIFTMDEPPQDPTWGISVTSFSPPDDESIQLNFVELGGTTVFSTLTNQLPVRQATYVLCYSLANQNLMDEIKPFLDILIPHIQQEESSIILFGTHANGNEPRESLLKIFQSTEKIIHDYVESLGSPVVPVVTGMFALDNSKRKVVSTGYSNMSKFSELLQWLMDHAVSRCKADKEAHALLSRGIELEARLASFCRKRKWYITMREYVETAALVSEDYQSDSELLSRETALLCDFGSLVVLQNNSGNDEMVVLDRRWANDILTVMALFQPFMFINGRIVTRDVIRGTDGLLLLSGYGLERFGLQLPFSLPDVLAKDEFGLLTHGVVTAKVLQALFHRLMAQRNPTTLSELIRFLELSDMLIRGSKILFPHANRSALPSPSGEVEEYYVVPSAFAHHPSNAVQNHLSRFLCGPFFQFKFTIIPRKYFSRLITRLASTTYSCYPGPSQPCQVEAKSSPKDKRRESPTFTCIPTSPRFWNHCVWLISDTDERAFLRLANNSIFLDFHSTNYRESEFVRGVLKTVLEKENSCHLYAEWLVQVEPPFLEPTKLGEKAPQELYYNPIDEKEDVIDDIAGILSPRDTEWSSDAENNTDHVCDVPFTRLPVPTSELTSLMEDIVGGQEGETEVKSVVESFCSWSETVSQDAEHHAAEEKGAALDKLVDAMSRLL